MPARPEERFSIGCLRLVDVLYARVFHRLEVQAPCRLPRTGAGILVCNHISGLDPILIQSVCPRLIVWMMAEEYARSKPLKRLFGMTQTILVQRTGRDLGATRQGLRVLRAGMILGIFPEGKIETSPELLPFQHGVAMMALHAGVPIYPAYLEGSQRGREMPGVFLRRQEAYLRFGEPLRLQSSNETKNSLAEATRIVQKTVARLKNQLICENRQNFRLLPTGESW